MKTSTHLLQALVDSGGEMSARESLRLVKSDPEKLKSAQNVMYELIKAGHVERVVRITERGLAKLKQQLRDEQCGMTEKRGRPLKGVPVDLDAPIPREVSGMPSPTDADIEHMRGEAILCRNLIEVTGQ